MEKSQLPEGKRLTLSLPASGWSICAQVQGQMFGLGLDRLSAGLLLIPHLGRAGSDGVPDFAKGLLSLPPHPPTTLSQTSEAELSVAGRERRARVKQ